MRSWNGLGFSWRGGIGLVLCLMLSAEGIVVSDDPSYHVVNSPSLFDGVGYLSSAGGTSGVLIGPWQVLTAAHAVRGYSSGTFSLSLADGYHSYQWDSSGIVFHPTVDLAVINLTDYVGLRGYEINCDGNEVGKTGILAGYGMSGTGSSVGAGGDSHFPRGVLRYGYNRIDCIASYSAMLLQFDFDSPQNTGTNGTLGISKEVIFALGDSGGPTFIDKNGTLVVAGIHVGLTDANSNGRWPDYGDIGRDIQVSSYAGWIHQFVPIPGDANNDGYVDILDLAILSTHYGKTSGTTWQQGDFTFDGAVLVDDLALLAKNYNTSSCRGSICVPEPAVIPLLISGCYICFRRQGQGV